jgi:hypothetical protein
VGDYDNAESTIKQYSLALMLKSAKQKLAAIKFIVYQSSGRSLLEFYLKNDSNRAIIKHSKNLE